MNDNDWLINDISSNLVKMNKIELKECVRILIKELEDAQLEYDYLNKEYDSMLKYKNILMSRIRQQD